jgi:hypothetical protein
MPLDSYFGHPLKYQSVLDLIRRLVKRTGITFTAHMLRHTHATELIRSGWDAAYVQKRLGHAHVQIIQLNCPFSSIRKKALLLLEVKLPVSLSTTFHNRTFPIILFTALTTTFGSSFCI